MLDEKRRITEKNIECQKFLRLKNKEIKKEIFGEEVMVSGEQYFARKGKNEIMV